MTRLSKLQDAFAGRPAAHEASQFATARTRDISDLQRQIEGLKRENERFFHDAAFARGLEGNMRYLFGLARKAKSVTIEHYNGTYTRVCVSTKGRDFIAVRTGEGNYNLAVLDVCAQIEAYLAEHENGDFTVNDEE